MRFLGCISIYEYVERVTLSGLDLSGANFAQGSSWSLAFWMRSSTTRKQWQDIVVSTGGDIILRVHPDGDTLGMYMQSRQFLSELHVTSDILARPQIGGSLAQAFSLLWISMVGP